MTKLVLKRYKRERRKTIIWFLLMVIEQAGLLALLGFLAVYYFTEGSVFQQICVIAAGLFFVSAFIFIWSVSWPFWKETTFQELSELRRVPITWNIIIMIIAVLAVIIIINFT